MALDFLSTLGVLLLLYKPQAQLCCSDITFPISISTTHLTESQFRRIIFLVECNIEFLFNAFSFFQHKNYFKFKLWQVSERLLYFRRIWEHSSFKKRFISNINLRGKCVT